VFQLDGSAAMRTLLQASCSPDNFEDITALALALYRPGSDG
jgi:DNA polymerase III alpha subunit